MGENEAPPRKTPRKTRWLLILGAVAMLAVGFWLAKGRVERHDRGPEKDSGTPAAATSPSSVASSGKAATPPSGVATAGTSALAPSAEITLMPVAAELSASLNREDESAEQNLQAVEQVLLMYRRGFGSNPVGQNEDIVTALLGENEKRAAYLPRDCPAIKDGKLVDRWGTPWWFHPLSGQHMELRSAGPDRELFTADDVVQP